MTSPGDAMEREADDMANRALRAFPPPTTLATAATSSVRGEPLDRGVRADMERRFKADFSVVRVHADDTAASSARALGAEAFTVGRDIVFGRGAYATHRETGRQLLAHELAHVVQQSTRAPVLARQVAHSGPDGTRRMTGVFLYSESLGRLGDTVIAEWPRHAFLRVTTAESDFLVELGRDPESGTDRTAAPLILPWDEVYERPPYRAHPGAVHRPSDPAAAAHFEERILELARSFRVTDPATGDYVRLPDYSVSGPNSNGYVRYLVQSAGGTIEMDSVSFPAEGVTDPYAEPHWSRETRSEMRRDAELFGHANR